MALGNRVRIVNCGYMSTDLTALLLKPFRTIRSRSQRDMTVEWYSAPTYCVVVDTPDGQLLWDTCCPRDWQQRWPDGAQEFSPYDQVGEQEYFDVQLAAMGVQPDSVDVVVLSHLHADHSGNIRPFAHHGDTRIVCSKAELAYAQGFEGPFQGAHIKSDYDGIDFELTSGDTEILPGVTLIELPGHTPGTLAMKVELPHTGTMIFTSDAVYMGDSYGPPVAPPAIVDDLGAWYASVERLRSIAEQSDATLVFGHDSAQMQELRLAPNGYYD